MDHHDKYVPIITNGKLFRAQKHKYKGISTRSGPGYSCDYVCRPCRDFFPSLCYMITYKTLTINTRMNLKPFVETDFGFL